LGTAARERARVIVLIVVQRETAMATDKLVQATTEVLNHVGHVREALKGFLDRDVRIQGVLTDPAVRTASLKWAQEELQRAVEIIEKTKWR
jgi:hypothetical protein